MKTKIFNNLGLFGAALVLLAIVAFLGISNIKTASASVAFGNDYSATTTAPNLVYGAQTATDMLIHKGQGSLGSVVITGANTGVMNFWDATTTNVSLRTGQIATSSLPLLASIPASAVAGTYTFDVQFGTGLIYDVPSGIIATTTITFR